MKPPPNKRVTSAIALVLAFAACGRREDSAGRQADTGFAAMQARGQVVMGVDQYASAHVFEDLGDGGRIVLDADSASDTAGIAAIRHHMRDIATAFRAGDFEALRGARSGSPWYRCHGGAADPDHL